jgi:Membrane bound beta barrel domain (DUF5777)
MKIKIIQGAILLLLVTHVDLRAQDDLLSGLKDELKSDPGYATSTFKSTRVINSHSIELLSEGSLDFRISHRFGRINSGAYNFFGLDQSTIRLGFEYGLSDRITLGIGRSSYEKTYDGFAKIKILRQRKNEQSSFPVSITWFSNISSTTLRTADNLVDQNHLYRYAYAHQLIIARKFNSSISLQVAPILVHRNLAEPGDNFNDTYAIEGGGRAKISKRISINADYIYRLPNYRSARYLNSASIGIDIETGGHIFQLHVTNSQGMIEEMFVSRTAGRLNKGDLFYGFNISRQFQVKKKS